MKRTLTRLVVASIVASPALAYGQKAVGPVDDTTLPVDTAILISAETLAESIAMAAHEVVSADVPALALPQGEGGKLGSGSRIAIGIAMIAGGAGIIWKGFDVYQDEPDRFGRVKNADSYVAWGVGGAIMFFGGLVLRGGLQGQGFQ